MNGVNDRSGLALETGNSRKEDGIEPPIGGSYADLLRNRNREGQIVVDAARRVDIVQVTGEPACRMNRKILLVEIAVDRGSRVAAIAIVIGEP